MEGFFCCYCSFFLVEHFDPGNSPKPRPLVIEELDLPLKQHHPIMWHLNRNWVVKVCVWKEFFSLKKGLWPLQSLTMTFLSTSWTWVRLLVAVSREIGRWEEAPLCFVRGKQHGMGLWVLAWARGAGTSGSSSFSRNGSQGDLNNHVPFLSCSSASKFVNLFLYLNSLCLKYQE